MEVKTENMDFGYGDTPVLHGIDLKIDEPGLVCIIGPNGVGKSTLVKCICKIIHPTQGTVYVDGHDLDDIPLKELAKVMGFVPVVSGDTFSMNVLDTVLMGRHPHQRMGTTSDLDLSIVDRTLNMMGISHLAMRNFNELSAGQHQKVMLARGLVQEPKVLLLDEPTSNLDVRHQLDVTKMLTKLSVEKGILIIMISHDINIAAKFSDEVIMMHQGHIYDVGTPDHVINEENLKVVYGVESKIVDDDGRPHVILKDAIPMDESADMVERVRSPVMAAAIRKKQEEAKGLVEKETSEA